MPQHASLLASVAQPEPRLSTVCVPPELTPMATSAFGATAATKSRTARDVSAPSERTVAAPETLALEPASSFPLISAPLLRARALSTWDSRAGRLPLTETP